MQVNKIRPYFRAIFILMERLKSIGLNHMLKAGTYTSIFLIYDLWFLNEKPN